MIVMVEREVADRIASGQIQLTLQSGNVFAHGALSNVPIYELQQVLQQALDAIVKLVEQYPDYSHT